MAEFNWVDYIILAIFFFSIWGGIVSGLAREIISLATWIVALVVACLFSQKLALVFTHSAVVQHVINTSSTSIGVNTSQPASYAALGISFAVLFIGTSIVGSLIGRVLHYSVESAGLNLGNRLLGGAFGLGRGFLLTLVAIFLIQLSPIMAQPWWQESQFVKAFQPGAQWLSNYVAPSMDTLKMKFNETLENVKGTTIDTYHGFQAH